jgi:hypothetical protein
MISFIRKEYLNYYNNQEWNNRAYHHIPYKPPPSLLKRILQGLNQVLTKCHIDHQVLNLHILKKAILHKCELFKSNVLVINFKLKLAPGKVFV